MAAALVGQHRARREKARLDNAGEGDARLGALGRRGGDGVGGQGFDGGDARAGGLRVGLVAFKADVGTAEAARDRARGARAEEGVDDDIAGIARRQHDARQQRLGLLGGVGLAALRVLEAFAAGADRQIPVGANLTVLVARLEHLVIEGVALRLRITRRPDHGLVGVGEAAAAEIRHRVGLAPDDVVENPEAEVLQDRPDPENVVVGADDEQRRLGLHGDAGGAQPGACKGVVFSETAKLVPIIVDRVDNALIGTRQRALELEIVGRVGEDEIDALGRQGPQPFNAVAKNDLVERGRARWRDNAGDGRNPGTRDLNPGFRAGHPGVNATHETLPGKQPTKRLCVGEVKTWFRDPLGRCVFFGRFR